MAAEAPPEPIDENQDLTSRAADFATHAHRRIDQRRKYTKQPYDVHLRAVAKKVATVTDDAEVIAAAWLHDTIEDTPATYEDIEAEFGPRVAQLVSELTDVSLPSDGNRAVRKAIDRRHLSEASPEAKTIKLSDLIDNATDIVRHDAKFGRVFVAEASLLLEVLEGGDSTLMKEARELVRTSADRLGMSQLLSGALTLPDLDAFTPPTEDPERRRRLNRLFGESFHALDITESLCSFDFSTKPRHVARILDDREVPVAGARHEGRMIGYVRRSDLDDGLQDSDVRLFESDQIAAGDAPLTDVVHILTRHEYCFVSMLGEVNGYISRAQMQGPAARMWLFGLVTFVEMAFTDRVKELYPNRSWQSVLSPARLEKARALQAHRAQRGVDVPLLECLQFGDKARLFINNKDNLKASGIKSKKAAKLVMDDLEALRDHLAHAQDVVTHNWPPIARLARFVEDLGAST
ncbi:MAG: HD domain-containing protein [Pseudomonadota bacterium]